MITSMKHIWIICLAWICVCWAVVAAADDELAESRRFLLAGNYAEAAEIYARSALETPAAALGLARSLAAEGKYAEAQRALSIAGEHADLHAELARLAFRRGDLDSANTHCQSAIRLDPDQLLARWIRGELLRVTGRLDEAEEAYKWLITYYNGHDVEDAESLRWIGLAAARYARWNRLGDQFRFLVNELYPDALKSEPGFWPAHYEAGMLFLEKYNRSEASKQFKAALALNPNAAEVHVALGQLALVDGDFRQAQLSVARALEINPKLLEAWLIMADLAWANFQPPEAIRILKQHALPLNPIAEQTLGRLAACYVIEDGLSDDDGRDSRFDRLVEQVTARNEHAGEFFTVLAIWLDDRHKLPEAERFFQEALRRMPRKISPKANLGMLYMHWGREFQAKALLEEAFEEDPFNVRTNNMLGVLEVLDSMTTLPTGHVTLKYDAETDELLARYAARHIDSVYPELCERFGYEPPGPPLIEIFSSAKGNSGHQWFSTRMTGLPYLGTVAASTGQMVAMVSPNDSSTARRFNWARVLTHELVHVVTLQQTHFNIPHWYTEALAVWSEGYPRPQAWNDLLARRVAQGNLLNLDTINFAFTRPQSSDDWQLAYCQAELYLEYIIDGYGQEAIGKLLGAYAENLTTGEAVRRVFGVSQEQFERGYVEHLKKIAAGLSSVEPPSTRSFTQLLDASRENPDDVDLAAELAYEYLRRGEDKDALKLASRALQTDRKHQLAAYVQGRVYVRTGRTQEAIRLLEDCLDREAPGPKALNLLAALHLKAENYHEAARLYELGARHHPHNLQWARALALVYVRSDNNEQLAKVLDRLARADAESLSARKQLAKMALSRGDYTAAADWANRALEIDVKDADLHGLFAEALLGCHNHREAVDEYEIAVELDPDYPGAAKLLDKLRENDKP